MASNGAIPTAGSGAKLRVLLIPYFATSHIEPITELAVGLVAANDAVEATVAVTPANVSIVQSVLDRGGLPPPNDRVKIATYPFPRVEGLPRGVENLGKAATSEESSRIHATCLNESLTRPAQEALVRAHSPDAIVTDMLFYWNGRVADEVGAPCVAFSVMGAFSMLALRHLADHVADDDDAAVVEVPRFPEPRVRIPRTELPEYLRKKDALAINDWMNSMQASCFGLVINTSLELEGRYCDMYTRNGYVKRAYAPGPLALLRAEAPAEEKKKKKDYIVEWLDSKPERSVVYLSSGSMAHAKDAQLDELAAGLEASGKSFLWVVRGKEGWSPPEGWETRVRGRGRGFIIRAWAPQTAILAHPALAAFVTQCGWNSVMETVAAGVPVLTWPIFYEQFITERQVTEVLGIGDRLWPDGAGVRSECHQDHGVVPAHDVARALTEFMRAGGPADAARIRVRDLAAKVHAGVAEGGSSHRDMRRLVDDLIAAADAKSKTSTPPT